MDLDDLEEELLAVAGRSRPSAGTKRTRKAANSSDEDYGTRLTSRWPAKQQQSLHCNMIFLLRPSSSFR